MLSPISRHYLATAKAVSASFHNLDGFRTAKLNSQAPISMLSNIWSVVRWPKPTIAAANIARAGSRRVGYRLSLGRGNPEPRAHPGKRVGGEVDVG